MNIKKYTRTLTVKHYKQWYVTNKSRILRFDIYYFTFNFQERYCNADGYQMVFPVVGIGLRRLLRYFSFLLTCITKQK